MEGCQFQGIFVGFCTTVNEKQTVVIVARKSTETMCQFLLQGIDYAVGIETQLAGLSCECFDVVWMAVPNADDSMSTIEVEVLLTFVIPNVATLSACDGDVEEGVYVI